MYLVHSYAPMVEDPADVAATISVNGCDIPAAIARGHVVGVQFLAAQLCIQRDVEQTGQFLRVKFALIGGLNELS